MTTPLFQRVPGPDTRLVRFTEMVSDLINALVRSGAIEFHGPADWRFSDNWLDYFARVAVAGQDDIVADAPGDTLTVAAGAGIALTTTAASDTLTVTSTITQYTDEMARDAAAAMIQNGTGISWVYNDPSDTLTPTVTLAPFTTADLAEGSNLYFTTERAQDAVGGILTDGTTIDFTYDDAANTITAEVAAGSLTAAKFAAVTAHYALLGPTLGSPATPTFRALELEDLPAHVVTDIAGATFGGVVTASSFVANAGPVTATSFIAGSNLNQYTAFTGPASTTKTFTLPNTDDTIGCLGTAGTWTAVQTYSSGCLKLAGATSGTITLNATATAGTNTITLPAVTGTAVTTGDTGTVTNTMLAGSIDLTTKVTGTLPAANGGTGSAFVAFSGPGTTVKTFVLPNANCSVLTDFTAVTPQQGGTGLTGYALGDTIYSDATNSLAKLSGNTTTTRKFLRQTGTGVVSAAPAWDTVTKTDVGLSAVENTALSTWAGSTNITTLGTITTGTWNAGAITTSGDITVTGTGHKFTAVFGDSTLANNLLFQSNSGATRVGAIPASGTSCDVLVFDGTDPDNAAFTGLRMASGIGTAGLDVGKTGTGTQLALSLCINTAPKWQVTTAGNLVAATTGQRFGGDMSNATISSRLLFQSTTTNGGTFLGLISNGTSVATTFSAYGANSPTNAPTGSFGHDGTNAFVRSTAQGSGTTGTLNFQIGTTTYAQLTTAGQLLVNGAAAGTTLLVVKAPASQTVDNFQAQDSTGAVGFRLGGSNRMFVKQTSAPADANVNTSEFSLWLDDTAGAAKLMIKAKDSGGTVRTGSVTLS